MIQLHVILHANVVISVIICAFVPSLFFFLLCKFRVYYSFCNFVHLNMHA